jgi:hypothetical protein
MVAAISGWQPSGHVEASLVLAYSDGYAVADLRAWSPARPQRAAAGDYGAVAMERP